METSPCEGNNGLLFANFNQDFGCFVCCVNHGRGFRIFNCDPLREQKSKIFTPPLSISPEAHPDHDFTEVGPRPPMSSNQLSSASGILEAVGCGQAKIIRAEMLFRCNYIALVIATSSPKPGNGGSSEPQGHKVVIWDDLKQMGVIQLEFNSEVRSVKLRRDRIVVVLKSIIKVYSFTAAPVFLHTFDTAPNFKGLAALSPSSNNSLLAFPTSETPSSSSNSAASSADHPMDPGSRSTGNVKLIDLANPNNDPLVLNAHTSSLSCMTLNIQGNRLATASEKGTLIRIFDTATGNLVNELRRGLQSATIYSINFSPDTSFVAASSSHGTIHVFSTEDSTKNKTSSLVSTATSMMGNLFGSSSSSSPPVPSSSSSGGSTDKAPMFVPKYFSSEWSFSRIEVPGATRCIVAFADAEGPPPPHPAAASGDKAADFSIIAICSDGSYYKFVYDDKKEAFTRDVYKLFVEDDVKL